MERPFFGPVESLRGMFCLTVAGWHSIGLVLHEVPLLSTAQSADAGWFNHALAWLLLLFLPGHAGLMVFFVISGCVLRVSLQYGPQDFLGATRRFFVARAFRIYPIVIASSLVSLTLNHGMVPDFLDQPAHPATVSAVLANMTLLRIDLNSILWAIQVEVLMAPFILLFYFVERWLGPAAVLAIAVVATPLSFAASIHSWILWSPFAHNFFAFVLGLVVPTIGRDWVRSLSTRACAICLVLIMLALLLPGRTIGFFSHISAVIEGYAAFGLVSFAAFRSELPSLSWLKAGVLRKLGLCSGSYYVFHPFCTLPSVAIATAVIPAGLCAQMPALALWISVLIYLIVIVPAAVVGFFCVETPGIALGQRVNRLFTRTTRVPVQRSVDIAVSG